jgi:hypothetical protein
VERLRDADAHAAKAFLRANYGAGFYGAEDRYFDWIYRDSPCGWFVSERAEGRLPINVVRGDDGTIAAIHAFLPFDARTPWGGQVGIWDLEWINASAPPGTGRMLARHLLDGVDIYAGYGCNDLSARAFARMGMKLVHEIPRRVAVLDTASLARALKEAGLHGTVPPSVAAGGEWSELGSTEALPEACLEAYRAATPFGAERERPWLAWRYDRHPFIDYRIVAAGEDAAILRIERTGTLAVCRICDFFPAGTAGKLLAAVLCFARDQGCALADYFSIDVAHAARLDAAADEISIALLDTPRLPFMFQPLAVGDRYSINLVIQAGGRAPAGVDPLAFHATKADANQDVMRSPYTAAQLRDKRA